MIAKLTHEVMRLQLPHSNVSIIDHDFVEANSVSL